MSGIRAQVESIQSPLSSCCQREAAIGGQRTVGDDDRHAGGRLGERIGEEPRGEPGKEPEGGAVGGAEQRHEEQEGGHREQLTVGGVSGGEGKRMKSSSLSPPREKKKVRSMLGDRRVEV